ncbi:MAG: pitrilysin family protein [Bacillota bacterium]|nr:pitrilysin family protein [Bacillota bacterium]
MVKPDHRSPVVVAQIWYKVGSAYEPGGVTGISHLCEHLMFKGTPKHPAGQFSKIIGENGGEENAMTSNDFTNYFQKLSNDRLEISFQLEADRMRNLNVPEAEFKKELEVVKEERRMRLEDVPEGLLYERFNAAAHLTSPYHHLTMGWMSDLNSVTLADAKAWYQKWYAPNNAILVVVGDVDPNHVQQLAEKYFGPLKPSILPTLKPQGEPPPVGERGVVVRAPAKLPMLFIGYNVPSLKTTKEPWKVYALAIISGILDSGDSSRLPSELVRRQQIASQAGAYYEPFALYSPLFILQGVPAEGKNVAGLKAALLAEIKRLQTTLIQPAELQRVKTQIIAQKVFAKDSQFGQAMEIGGLESVGLSWREGTNYVEQVKKITPEQIQAVAKEYLISDRLTLGELQALPITQNAVKRQPIIGAHDHD